MLSVYRRVHGVYARLIANDYVGSGVILHCYASDTEQSVAIFSASACGLFGFDSVFLAVNGNESGGTFRLIRHGSVMIRRRERSLVAGPVTSRDITLRISGIALQRKGFEIMAVRSVAFLLKSRS